MLWLSTHLLAQPALSARELDHAHVRMERLCGKPFDKLTDQCTITLELDEKLQKRRSSCTVVASLRRQHGTALHCMVVLHRLPSLQLLQGMSWVVVLAMVTLAGADPPCTPDVIGVRRISLDWPSAANTSAGVLCHAD
jgi:hypothetical protein